MSFLHRALRTSVGTANHSAITSSVFVPVWRPIRLDILFSSTFIVTDLVTVTYLSVLRHCMFYILFDALMKYIYLNF